MEKPTILVTGAGGQLAMSIRNIALQYPQFEFVFFNRADLPIEDKQRVNAVFEQIQPRFCVNCAAYTAVDKAEAEREPAFLVNAGAVKNLAETCVGWNTSLVHISTDYVFNGASSIPYKETDRVDPLNVYGASKASGEVLAMSHNPGTIILRTSWVYSEYGNNFVKTMIRLMKEKTRLNIVSDQLGSPTYAGDLAHAILKIIGHSKWLPGIYHYCNEGSTSRYEFAGTIKALTAAGCILYPIPSDAYPVAARRPAYSLLDTTKIKASFNLRIPFWKDSLELCISNLLS